MVGLYIDSQGTLWVGTLSGFWRWEPGPPRFYAVSDEGGAGCFSEDDTHSLLIPLRARVMRLHEGALEAAFAYPGGAPRAGVCQVLRDKDGAYWITTLKGLIRVYGGKAKSFTEVDGLTRNAVNARFEDREGSIWVGTTGGLDRFAAASVRTFTERNGVAVHWVPLLLNCGVDPAATAQPRMLLRSEPVR